MLIYPGEIGYLRVRARKYSETEAVQVTVANPVNRQ